jgi:putative DNA primase/helicase
MPIFAEFRSYSKPKSIVVTLSLPLLMVWFDDPGAWKNIDRPPKAEARAVAVDLFSRLAKFDPAKPLRARFSDKAQELFDHWRSELENNLRSGKLHPALESHLAKYRKLMPSLALKFSLAEADASRSEADYRVGLNSVRLAAAWCAYLESHARRVYGSILSPSAASAHLLAGRIARGELPVSFAARDVCRKCWSGLDKPDFVYGALQVLCGLHWLQGEKVTDTGGRKGSLYRVNPAVVK